MPEIINSFCHSLGARVRLVESDEAGEVIARAQYINAADAYLIRYRAADGKQTEAWWTDDALHPEPRADGGLCECDQSTNDAGPSPVAPDLPSGDRLAPRVVHIHLA